MRIDELYSYAKVVSDSPLRTQYCGTSRRAAARQDMGRQSYGGSTVPELGAAPQAGSKATCGWEGTSRQATPARQMLAMAAERTLSWASRNLSSKAPRACKQGCMRLLMKAPDPPTPELCAAQKVLDPLGLCARKQSMRTG